MKISQQSFNNIFIVSDRNYWESCENLCDKSSDLILTIDFGLKHILQNHGYNILYLDHIQNQDSLKDLNYKVHEFLNSWYKREDNTTLLTYKGFNIGDSLQLDLLNSITYFTHFFLNFICIQKIPHKNLYLSIEDDILQIFKKTGIPFINLYTSSESKYPQYWFPIHKWMTNMLNKTGLYNFIKVKLLFVIQFLKFHLDRVFKYNGHYIYIQTHYPTISIYESLNKDKRFRIIRDSYSSPKKIFSERCISYSLLISKSFLSDSLYKEFIDSTKLKWVHENYNISNLLYELICPIVKEKLPIAIQKIHDIEYYFKNKKLSLMVPVTNLVMENRLIMQYCFSNSIPVFTIINGLLNLNFWSDSKDSTWVNCYSLAMRNDYFQNASNAIPLGDPRMDSYSNIKKRKINYDESIFLIGTSAFNHIDLNSFLAVEFEFMFSILKTIREFCSSGRKIKIKLKTRSNAYSDQYRSLLSEYFPTLDVEILENVNFKNALENIDLYITFYSQTVFEASVLGIPVIYYRNDTQIVNPPFDGNSELVTAANEIELHKSVNDFYNNPDIYKHFLKVEIMEKYVGKLDGKNKERNVEFINSIILKKIESDGQII